jgi:hypothetical protein
MTQYFTSKKDKYIALFNINENQYLYNNNNFKYKNAENNLNNSIRSIAKPIINTFIEEIPIIIINSQDSISGSEKHLQHFIRNYIDESENIPYMLLSKTDATKKKYTSIDPGGLKTYVKKEYNVRTRIYININKVNINKGNTNTIKNMLNSHGKKTQFSKNKNNTKDINILTCKRKRFTNENNEGTYGGGKIGYELVFQIKNEPLKQSLFNYNIANFTNQTLNSLNYQLELSSNFHLDETEEYKKSYIFIFTKENIYVPKYSARSIHYSRINKNNLINFKNNKRNYTIFNVEQLNSINSEKIKQNKINKKQKKRTNTEELLYNTNSVSNKSRLIKNTNNYTNNYKNNYKNLLTKIAKINNKTLGLNNKSKENLDKNIKEMYTNLNPIQKLSFLKIIQNNNSVKNILFVQYKHEIMILYKIIDDDLTLIRNELNKVHVYSTNITIKNILLKYDFIKSNNKYFYKDILIKFYNYLKNIVDDYCYHFNEYVVCSN